jgi:hypothetical protein
MSRRSEAVAKMMTKLATGSGRLTAFDMALGVQVDSGS